MVFCISVILMSWPPRFGVSFPVWMPGSWRRRSTRGPMRSSRSIRRLAVAERRALALVAICQDVPLSERIRRRVPTGRCGGDRRRRTAVESSGERGVSVLAGPRLGPGALEEILCNGNVDLIGLTENGKPLDLGRRSRTVGRKLRRHVLHRDGDAPWKAARSVIGSKSTMSSPGHMAERPMRTI